MKSVENATRQDSPKSLVICWQNHGFYLSSRNKKSGLIQPGRKKNSTKTAIKVMCFWLSAGQKLNHLDLNYVITLDCIALHCRGAKVMQTWDNLPPSNVVWVWILVLTLYVGWVCCWFPLFLPEGFLWILQFSPFLKNQRFQISIQSGKLGHVSRTSYQLLSSLSL